jgi:hypothetical protein
MIEREADAENAPPHYIPSGRVSPLRLGLATIAGASVALVMAILLLMAERRFYFPFLTALILGLPVFASIFLVVRWGECRNRGLGGLVGVVLIFVYYAGYWELSYLANVVTRGPRMVAACARIGRLPGLPGYVVFRCRSPLPRIFRRGIPNRLFLTPFAAIFNGILLGGETLMITALGASIGRTAAARAFSDRYRRWATRFEFRLPLATTSAVQEAIERGDWASLAELPRVSSIVNANTNSLLFRLDYFERVRDEPAYVTLIASASAVSKVLMNDRLVPPEQLVSVAHEFPELKIPGSEQLQGKPIASQLEASLDRLGLSERTEGLVESDNLREADFRDAAVAASREVLARLHPRNFRTVPSSLCLPAGSGGAGELKRAGRRHALLQAILSVGMIGSLIVGLVGTRLVNPGRRELNRLVVAGGLGFLLFAVPNLIVATAGDRVRRPFLIHRLRNRFDSMIHEGAGLPFQQLRIGDARTYHRMKLSGEDLGIAIFDGENRRLLFEGLSHRYVIRGEDVTCLWPLQSHSIISARIDYLIGDDRLALVFSRGNPWFHLWGPSGKRAVADFVSMLSETLGHQPQTESESAGILSDTRS